MSVANNWYIFLRNLICFRKIDCICDETLMEVFSRWSQTGGGASPLLETGWFSWSVAVISKLYEMFEFTNVTRQRSGNVEINYTHTHTHSEVVSIQTIMWGTNWQGLKTSLICVCVHCECVTVSAQPLMPNTPTTGLTLLWN